MVIARLPKVHLCQLLILATGLLVTLTALPTRSENLKLTLPIFQESQTLHLYFHELLRTALEEAGHQVEIKTQAVPQKRAVLMFEQGLFSAVWLVESGSRNESYPHATTGLTNGLIGKRILLIRKEDQPLFDQIHSIDDLRQSGLVAGLGDGWFDTRVWAQNGLPFLTKSGSWQQIYDMLRMRREYDYFPRGLNEIVAESKEHRDLAIEKRLALIYERDFLFYFSPKDPQGILKQLPAIEQALSRAREAGLIDRLVARYWKQDFEQLNYDTRLKLTLESPSAL